MDLISNVPLTRHVRKADVTSSKWPTNDGRRHRRSDTAHLSRPSPSLGRPGACLYTKRTKTRLRLGISRRPHEGLERPQKILEKTEVRRDSHGRNSASMSPRHGCQHIRTFQDTMSGRTMRQTRSGEYVYTYTNSNGGRRQCSIAKPNILASEATGRDHHRASPCPTKYTVDLKLKVEDTGVTWVPSG